VVDAAETPLAAMRSRLDLQRLGRSGSPARLVNHADRILFQNRCTPGCVLPQPRRATQRAI
jgi:hypothetical protein